MDGSNAKMSEYHAAIGLAQAARWRRVKHRRSSLLKLYVSHLAPLSEEIALQHAIESAVVSLLVLMLKRPIAGVLLPELAKTGVSTHRNYLPPLYRHPHFAKLAVSNTRGEIMPPEASTEQKQTHMVHSEELLAHLVGIPFHSFMTESDVVSVVGAVSRLLQES